MRTPHFRGNGVENIDFQRLYRTLFNVPTAPQRLRSAALRLYDTRSFVAQRFKSAFHVFALAKTFHFCAEDMLAYCSLLSAQKFHVLRKGARFRTLLIVPLRRTSGCSVTLPGHMSIRVHRRTRDLRVILDKGAAGNTCRIVKAHLFKSARKAASSYVPA